MSNEQLEFDIGENESPATVDVDEKGNAQVIEESNKPEAQATTSDDLDQYSDKVKKRIDKLTARLRETERREQAAINTLNRFRFKQPMRSSKFSRWILIDSNRQRAVLILRR